MFHKDMFTLFLEFWKDSLIFFIVICVVCNLMIIIMSVMIITKL